MIDGLKLTLTGQELQQLLEARAAEHRAIAERWTRQRARRVEDQIEDEPLLPDHMCENEAERHEWRAEVLDFLRQHLETGETYRLAESDLAFGELLPAKPGWFEQQEYEERTNVRSEFEWVGKRICLAPEIIEISNPNRA